MPHIHINTDEVREYLKGHLQGENLGEFEIKRAGCSLCSQNFDTFAKNHSQNIGGIFCYEIESSDIEDFIMENIASDSEFYSSISKHLQECSLCSIRWKELASNIKNSQEHYLQLDSSIQNLKKNQLIKKMKSLINRECGDKGMV